jgi:hypothetical protein
VRAVSSCDGFNRADRRGTHGTRPARGPLRGRRATKRSTPVKLRRLFEAVIVIRMNGEWPIRKPAGRTKERRPDQMLAGDWGDPSHNMQVFEGCTVLQRPADGREARAPTGCKDRLAARRGGRRCDDLCGEDARSGHPDRTGPSAPNMNSLILRHSTLEFAAAHSWPMPPALFSETRPVRGRRGLPD